MEIKTTKKSSNKDFESGLMKPKSFDWIPNVINSFKAMSAIRSRIPEDGTEIVGWMQEATAANAVLEAMEQEYAAQKVGIFSSQAPIIRSASGDAYTPGVKVDNLTMIGGANYGSTVGSRGYGVLSSPQGDYNIPAPGKMTIADRDILAFASIINVLHVQITSLIMNFTSLAALPVSERIRFGSFSGYVSPLAFTAAPGLPTPIDMMKIGMTSDKEQDVDVMFIGEKGSYETQVYAPATFSIPEGESETVITLLEFPFVRRHTVLVQPKDNTETVLDYLELTL